MSDHGKCFECGHAAGENPGCKTCAMWARIIEAARVNRRQSLRTATVPRRKARKPQRQPSPMIEVGNDQLPPSDR
jgi:predicted ATP-dependent serine protease